MGQSSDHRSIAPATRRIPTRAPHQVSHRTGWAHLPSTEWHAAWLTMVPPTHREQRRGQHRADIITYDGWVIEVQHAPMAAVRIAGRELDHGNMEWIWDGRKPYRERRLTLDSFSKGVVHFTWRQVRPTLRTCRRRCLVDIGELAGTDVRVLLDIEQLNAEGTGIGRLITHGDMRLWMRFGIKRRSLLELPPQLEQAS